MRQAIQSGLIIAAVWVGVLLPGNAAAHFARAELGVNAGRARGLALADFDGDGDQDLAVAHADRHLALFQQDGGRLADVAPSFGLARPPVHDTRSLHWLDYDRDGDLDLYAANRGSANQLFRRALLGFNDLAGSLAVDDAGVAALSLWSDFDADGDVDGWLVNESSADLLWINESAGLLFTDAAAAWALPDLGVVGDIALGDVDRDGDTDAFVSSTTGNHRLLLHEDRTWVDATSAWGIIAGRTGVGAAFADFDGNGTLDLAQAIADGADRLYVSDGAMWQNQAADYGVDDPRASQSVSWVDYDLDGWLDLCVVGDGFVALRRHTGGRFVDLAGCEALASTPDPAAVLWGDLDQDQDTDLVVAADGAGVQIYLNTPTIPDYRGTGVALAAFKAERLGSGATLERVGSGARFGLPYHGQAGRFGQSWAPLIIGAGRRGTVDVKVGWPRSREPQEFRALPVGQDHHLVETVVDSLGLGVVGFLPIDAFEPAVADVWGFEQAGREYALVCAGNALWVVDTTDPAALREVARVPGTLFDLKDVKVYRSNAYAVQENGRVLVIDLSDPPRAQVVRALGLEAGYHNAAVDTTRALLYLVGHAQDEAMQIYDLAIEPELQLASYGDSYAHDVVVDGHRALVARMGQAGAFEWVDVRNPSQPRLVSRFTHPDASPHSGAFAADGRHILTCDERVGGHLFVWDAADTLNVLPVAEYALDSESSIHNVFVAENLAFVSYYNHGVRVLDITDPALPVEVGHYESSRFYKDDCSFSVFRGVWGVYPYATSGHIYWTDMCGGGLYVGRLTAVPARRRLTPPAPTTSLWIAPVAAGSAALVHTPQPGPLRLRLYDVHGRLWSTLVDGASTGTTTRVELDAALRGAPLGVYFLEAVQAPHRVSRRFVHTRR